MFLIIVHVRLLSRLEDEIRPKMQLFLKISKSPQMPHQKFSTKLIHILSKCKSNLGLGKSPVAIYWPKINLVFPTFTMKHSICKFSVNILFMVFFKQKINLLNLNLQSIAAYFLAIGQKYSTRTYLSIIPISRYYFHSVCYVGTQKHDNHFFFFFRAEGYS